MGNKKLTLLATLTVFSLAVGAVTMLPAFALGEAEYAAGVDAYKKKDYKKAAEQFRAAISKGNKSAATWLYAAHTFSAQGQYLQAFQTYEIITKTFKDSPEAAIATQGMESLRGKPGVPAGAAPATPAVAAAGAAPGAPPAAPGAVAPVGLEARITVIPPAKNHPAVSPSAIKAVHDAVKSIPAKMRTELDNSGASIVLAPNPIDRWPDMINDLPEDKDEPTLAEAGGRIYGKEICVYERSKVRGANTLKEARPTNIIKQTVFNCSFQIIDDLRQVAKDPALRKIYDFEKANVPAAYTEKLATFLKDDDWGARETCSELTGAILGGSDEYTDDLSRFFPRTKVFLKAKLGI